MLTSQFLSYFYILHSKSQLRRLYGNSSTACSLLLCYTLPCSWRSQRSQGTAGPRAQLHGRESHELPVSVPGCSVAQELLTPWGACKAWEEDATPCYSLLGSCFSQGCKLSVFSPSRVSGCSGTTLSIPVFSNLPLMPRQKHWQGTATVDTAMGSNEILVRWSQASQSGVECGQKMVMNASAPHLWGKATGSFSVWHSLDLLYRVCKNSFTSE